MIASAILDQVKSYIEELEQEVRDLTQKNNELQKELDLINKNDYITREYKPKKGKRSLDETQAKAIRLLYQQGITVSEIADHFNVETGTISSIVNGITYRDAILK